MCLRHSEFRKWLTSQNATDNILAVIVDEVHCISQWGSDFCPDYAKIEKIHALLPLGIPFLTTSAMLASPALRDINSKLHIDINTSYFINLGNNRPNISTEVHEIKGSTDFDALFTYFPVNASSPNDLKKTIIFTNVVNHTQKISQELRKQFGPCNQQSINYLHHHRTAKAKQWVMQRFREGKIKILVATEAAGIVFNLFFSGSKLLKKYKCYTGR